MADNNKKCTGWCSRNCRARYHSVDTRDCDMCCGVCKTKLGAIKLAHWNANSPSDDSDPNFSCDVRNDDGKIGTSPLGDQDVQPYCPTCGMIVFHGTVVYNHYFTAGNLDSAMYKFVLVWRYKMLDDRLIVKTINATDANAIDFRWT